LGWVTVFGSVGPSSIFTYAHTHGFSNENNKLLLFDNMAKHVVASNTNSR
jgi:ligand-binding SRPBCC domain-containing protein